MKLIVGLGNPGAKYAHTRHNVGFDVVDMIARANGVELDFDQTFNAQIGKELINGETTILAKPNSFMNSSGMVVNKLREYFKIVPPDIIIVHDDLDIPAGEYRFSFAKNAGGHLGVQSIIDCLKTNGFVRVRVGIAGEKLKHARNKPDKEEKKEAVGQYVLSRFTSDELEIFKKVSKNVLKDIVVDNRSKSRA